MVRRIRCSELSLFALVSGICSDNSKTISYKYEYISVGISQWASHGPDHPVRKTGGVRVSVDSELKKEGMGLLKRLNGIGEGGCRMSALGTMSSGRSISTGMNTRSIFGVSWPIRDMQHLAIPAQVSPMIEYSWMTRVNDKKSKS